MKRFLLAVLFFAVLIALCEWAFRAKIWSPVLLPAPQQVAEYLNTVATDTGVRHVPPIYRRAALTMGSKRLHIWLKVILPAALPFIVSGMKQGWAFAWRSLMAAEIFVTILTGFGLGQLLHYGRELSAMDQVIGIMLVIVVIGLLADKILFSPVERFLHRRWGTNP